MPQHIENLVIGRASICWGCGDKFVLDEIAMKDDMPQCMNCRNGILKSTETPINVYDIDDIIGKMKDLEKSVK
jgi:DNA-directed RNA polymerase subunit RPC12/RpoP